MSELDVRELMERYDAERDKVVEQWRKRYLRWLRVQTPGRDGKLRDVPPFTPWLLIRYSATDLGARPLPPGTVFWASPDIWVESSDPLGNPVAGQDNFLHARLYRPRAHSLQRRSRSTSTGLTRPWGSVRGP